MLESIIIEGKNDTYFTPTIILNAQTGVCEIKGESYLEDTVGFYRVVLDWLRSYFESGKPIEFNFNLTYFNTSSSRSLLDILKTLHKYKEGGAAVTINWHYSSEDEDMLEEAEDFMADSKLNFNLIPYDNLSEEEEDISY